MSNSQRISNVGHEDRDGAYRSSRGRQSAGRMSNREFDERSRRPSKKSETSSLPVRSRHASDNTIPLDAYPGPPSGLALPAIARASSDAQDVRLSVRQSKHLPSEFPPKLELSRFSRHDSDTPSRSSMQSPLRDALSSPLESPKYTTPLDKSVIWRLGELGPTENKLAYVNEQLQRHGLHTVPDYRGGRILINGKTNERDSGYTQFVGSILAVDDVNGVSLLSTIPPVTTVNSRLLGSVMKHWKDLELLEAEDGATLGLYWYRDQWIIRTAGSFDAGSITWDGRATFGQMISDVMKKYPQFHYKNLDPTKCYTFGIKHPAIHAYHEGREYPIVRAWFIQSVDIARVNAQFGMFNGSVQFDESIGIPLHQIANAATFTALRTIPMSMHPQYDNYTDLNPDNAQITLKTILDHTRGALGSVISGAYGTNPAARYYGIILRSKKCTFFIPSDLYQYIASTCYTNELNAMFGSEQFNRDKFIVLFNALCPDRDREIFACIYPQYNTMMRRIRDYLRNEFVIAMYAQYNKLYHNVVIDNIYSQSTLDLARSLFVVWVRQYDLPKSQNRARMIELFSDYVLEKRNARVLYHDVYANIPEDVI